MLLSDNPGLTSASDPVDLPTLDAVWTQAGKHRHSAEDPAPGAVSHASPAGEAKPRGPAQMENETLT